MCGHRSKVFLEVEGGRKGPETANCSRVSAHPVSEGLVSLESLLTELLVASFFNCVELHSVRVAVNVMVLGEQVRHWVDGEDHGEHHHNDNTVVWSLVLAKEGDVLGDVVSHLWSRSWSTIVVFDHTIVKLRWHGNDHVIVVWVEVATFWHIKTEWRRVMVACQQVVWVVGKTWVHSGSLSQIGRPHTLVGVLGLMDSHVWWPDSVLNAALTVVPLLEVVTTVFLMTWMDLWQVNHSLHELSLLETLVHKQVVLLMHSSVASRACSAENLKASSKPKSRKNVSPFL